MQYNYNQCGIIVRNEIVRFHFNTYFNIQFLFWGPKKRSRCGVEITGWTAEVFSLDFLHERGVFVFSRASRKLNVKSKLKIVLVPHIALHNPFSLVIVIPGVKIFVHIKEIVQ